MWKYKVVGRKPHLTFITQLKLNSMLTRQMRELERQATVVNYQPSTSNYVITYKTADNEIGVINVTGEDHIDAEATFYMIADENGWAIEEVMSVTVTLEMTDEMYEMEDHDNWLDRYSY